MTSSESNQTITACLRLLLLSNEETTSPNDICSITEHSEEEVENEEDVDELNNDLSAIYIYIEEEANEAKKQLPNLRMINTNTHRATPSYKAPVFFIFIPSPCLLLILTQLG
eukprot:scaffold4193_cov109-Skeletonema_dohrnii-CCMP3373.AAC.4